MLSLALARDLAYAQELSINTRENEDFWAEFIKPNFVFHAFVVTVLQNCIVTLNINLIKTLRLCVRILLKAWISRCSCCPIYVAALERADHTSRQFFKSSIRCIFPELFVDRNSPERRRRRKEWGKEEGTFGIFLSNSNLIYPLCGSCVYTVICKRFRPVVMCACHGQSRN
jgi:hypothetical protein